MLTSAVSVFETHLQDIQSETNTSGLYPIFPEKYHNIHVSSVGWSTQSSVKLEALSGYSAVSIFTPFGFIIAGRAGYSPALSVSLCVCLCVSGCSSWTGTVRAAPSRCVSFWPNRASWCRKETLSARRCRTFASRYERTRKPQRSSWQTVHSLNKSWIVFPIREEVEVLLFLCHV